MSVVLDGQGRFVRVMGPRPLSAGGQWQVPRVTGITDAATPPSVVPLEQIYASQPMVAAVVNKLVRTFASIPLKVYRLDEETGDRVRVRAGSSDRGADLAALLARPMPRAGASSVKQWISLPAMIYGNSVIAKFRPRAGRPPVGLVPLDWRFVNGYAPQGQMVEWWSTTQLGSDERWLRAGEALHFMWDSPTGVIGSSPLEALARTLRLEDAAARYMAANFMNGSHMGGLLIPPENARMTEQSLAITRDSIEVLHRGPDSAGRIGLGLPGSQWVNTSFSPADQEVIETRVFNRHEVCIAYDVKPPLIGDLVESNFSSLVELNRDFHKTTMRPWYTMAEETLKAQLIDPEPEWEGLFVEFDLSEVLRGDPLAEAQAIERGINSGTLTPLEGRQIQNRAATGQDGEDLLYLPVNNLQPIGSEPTKVPVAVGDHAMPGSGEHAADASTSA